MAKNNHAINALVAGEVSPKFQGRYDTQQYSQGCEDATNWIIFPQGGGARRPGTMHVQQVKDAFYAFDQSLADDNTYRDRPSDCGIIRFIASDGKRFLIIMKNWKPIYPGNAGATVNSWYALDVATNTPISIYPFNPANTFGSSAAAIENEYDVVMKTVDMREIQTAQVGNRLYFAHIKFRPFYLQYVRSVDGNPSYFNLVMLGRTEAINTNDNNYSVIAQMPYQAPYFAPASGPYRSIKVLTPAGTWDATTGAVLTTNGLGHISDVIFHPGWVGRTIKFSKAGATTVWRVVGYNDQYTVNAVWMGGAQLGNSSNIYGFDTGSNYEISYWGGDLGWPPAVTGFEGRIFFGGGVGFPDTYVASQTNNVDRIMVRKFEQDPTFTNPTVATDPFDATLRSETISQIRWFASGKNITCGTNEREFVIQGPSSSQTIGPTNIQSNAETPYGSAPIQPVRVENTTVFIQRHRGSLRELVYSLEEASFKASNLNIISEHIANKSAVLQKDYFTKNETYFTKLAMQQAQIGILWALDSDGNLIGMTRDREQSVLAWHYHTIGGESVKRISYNPTGFSPEFPYKARVRCITTMQAPVTADTLSEPDDLYLIVERPLRQEVVSFPVQAFGMVPKFFIERLAPFWNKRTLAEGWDVTTVRKIAPVYMDGAVVYDMQSIPLGGVITNVPFSELSTVSVNVCGIDKGEIQVSIDRTINLSGLYETEQAALLPGHIIVGYNYVADLVPLTPEVPTQTGSAFAELRRIEDVTVNFVRTVAAQVGCVKSRTEANTPINNLEEVNFKPPLGLGPRQMYSQYKKIDYPRGYELKPRVLIRSNRPLPCEVADIVLKLVVVES